jgi:YD repeat-containing protein
MKRVIVVVMAAALILIALPCLSQSVTGVSVSGPVIGGAGPTATLSVTVDRNGYSGFFEVVVNPVLGITCAPGDRLPYGYGCYLEAGANTVEIQLSSQEVTQATTVTMNAQLEYENDPGKNVDVTVLPQPTKADCPTCCSRGGQGCFAGRPINLSNGNTIIVQTDIRQVPGLGEGLRLVRTWNSKLPAELGPAAIGMFGLNWRSSYEERVFVGSDGSLKYSRGDGGLWSFTYANSKWTPISPANVNATVVAGTSAWTITFSNGEQRFFDNTSGNLLAIIDRNGNSTQLSYDGLGRLGTVTDPAARHLNFNYSDPSSRLVVGVSSDIGYAASYSYDSLGRLVQVTEPDNSNFLFEYDQHSFISAVKDSNGKILEAHTYDSMGRGLSSSRADGVESLTVSYPVSPSN